MVSKAVHLQDKLKPFCSDPFKNVNRPTEVTYELLTQKGKTFHTHGNHLIPYYPKELLLFPHIRLYNEQKFEITHDLDTTALVQTILHTLYDNSHFDDKIFEDDIFCDIDDDQSCLIMNYTNLQR